MKKCVMSLMVALIFIMLSACISMAKNQQSETLTSQIINQPINMKEVIVAPSAEESVPPKEDIAIPTQEPFVLKEVVIAPPVEEPVASEEDIATPTQEPFVLKEVVVASPVEEPVASEEDIASPVEGPNVIKEAIAAPPIEESLDSNEVIVIAPVVADENPIQESNKQKKSESIPEENIQGLVNTWLTSWESGDFDTYRNCYASDFRSKGMTLDAWIDNKINVRKKSQNISISMDDLQISEGENTATAKFYLHYTSSILDSSGKKKLEFKKTKDGWKIYKEIMKP